MGKRWKAVIRYGENVSPREETIFFDEFPELGEIIEGGPDFRLIEAITVSYEFGKGE